MNNVTTQLLFGTLLVAIGAGPVSASSMTEVQVTFAANTKNIHFIVDGHLIDTIDPRPDSLKGKGSGFASETLGGTYNAKWDTPPGAGAYTFTLNRDNTGGWNAKWWLTTDGSLKSKKPADANTFASLFVVPVGGGTAVYAENEAGASDQTLTGITATLVTGLASYSSPNWSTAPGLLVTLLDTLVAAGSPGMFVGNVSSIGPDQWMRLNFNADGVDYAFGYTPDAVPEPATLLLLGSGLAGLAAFRKRRGQTRQA